MYLLPLSHLLTNQEKKLIIMNKLDSPHQRMTNHNKFTHTLGSRFQREENFKN